MELHLQHRFETHTRTYIHTIKPHPCEVPSQQNEMNEHLHISAHVCGALLTFTPSLLPTHYYPPMITPKISKKNNLKQKPLIPSMAPYTIRFEIKSCNDSQKSIQCIICHFPDVKAYVWHSSLSALACNSIAKQFHARYSYQANTLNPSTFFFFVNSPSFHR